MTLVVACLFCGATSIMGLFTLFPRIKRTWAYKKCLDLDKSINSVLWKSPTIVHLNGPNQGYRVTIANLELRVDGLMPTGVSTMERDSPKADYVILDYDKFAVSISQPVFPGHPLIQKSEIADYVVLKEVMSTLLHKLSEVFSMGEAEFRTHESFIDAKAAEYRFWPDLLLLEGEQLNCALAGMYDPGGSITGPSRLRYGGWVHWGVLYSGDSIWTHIVTFCCGSSIITEDKAHETIGDFLARLGFTPIELPPEQYDWSKKAEEDIKRLHAEIQAPDEETHGEISGNKLHLPRPSPKN